MSARTIRAAPVHTTAGHPAYFKPRRAWLCHTAGFARSGLIGYGLQITYRGDIVRGTL